MRHHNRTYSNYPQKPTFETPKVVQYDEDPRKYSAEGIVERALEGDANCREWLGLPITRTAPEECELPPETHAVCANPKCPHKGRPQPLTAFYPDKRKKNRRYSYCKACHRKITSEARRIGARVEIGVM